MSNASTPQPALVSRSDGRDAAYLMLSAAGATDWTRDPKAATAFASMREAMRMAMRLPASLKAYGLPQRTEALVH